jgi:hypothetical protein
MYSKTKTKAALARSYGMSDVGMDRYRKTISCPSYYYRIGMLLSEKQPLLLDSPVGYESGFLIWMKLVCKSKTLTNTREHI